MNNRLRLLSLLVVVLTLTGICLPAPVEAHHCGGMCPWSGLCGCNNQHTGGCGYVYNPAIDPDCCIPTSGTCPWLCC